MFIHDDGVVPAQLEEALAHARGDALPDLSPDRRGTRERHEIDALVVDESAGQFVGPVIDQEEHRRQVHLGQRLVDHSLHRNAAKRRFWRRFPDRDVAADCGNAGVPGINGHREVERRDDPDDAERMPLFVHPVLGSFGVHGLAIQHA